MADIQNIGSRGSAWQTLLDVAVAPHAAFTRLRETPTWGWAFLTSTILAIVATIAIEPVTLHVLGIEIPARLAADPTIAKLPAAARDAQIAKVLGITQTTVRFSFIVVPFGLALGSALQAVAMLIANALGKGDGTFKQFWAVAVNAALIGTGISSVVLMVIVLIRGAGGFASSQDIAAAVPGLGLFAPTSAKAAQAFLSVINVFAIWNMVLLVIGMTIVGRLSRATAIVTAILMLLGTAFVPLIGASLQK